MAKHHPVVSDSAWLAARRKLLAKEKAFTRSRDTLTEARRALPWQAVAKEYAFEGRDGRQTLPELFDGRSQLIVYHFMFGPGWGEGCPLCSFWADSFNAMPVHLAHRNAALVAVSRAPFGEIDAYRQRMGWSFPWYSSAPGDFNYDFGVSATPEQRRGGGGEYNFRRVDEPAEESPGLSVFAIGDRGEIFHTYSTYSRGLDQVNSGYQLLDLLPKGRDEKDLPWSMAWVRRHDSY